MKNETWRPVEGFKDYEVSNLGRVKSHKHNQPKIMSPVPRSADDQRTFLMLRKDNKSHTKFVSRLVAEAFVPNPEGFNSLKFKDGDASNNEASNLEWISTAELINATRARNGTKKEPVECLADGCTAAGKARGLCPNHYSIWWRNEREPDGSQRRYVKELVGYPGAHTRVVAERGVASRYKCACGSQAEEYSLLITAKKVYIESGTRYNGMLYSLDTSDYEAMCKACHRAYDAKHREAYRKRAETAEVVVTAPPKRRSTIDRDAIVESLKSGSTLGDMADEYNVHESYISRIFLDEVGMNLRSYRLQGKGVAA